MQIKHTGNKLNKEKKKSLSFQLLEKQQLITKTCMQRTDSGKKQSTDTTACVL